MMTSRPRARTAANRCKECAHGPDLLLAHHASCNRRSGSPGRRAAWMRTQPGCPEGRRIARYRTRESGHSLRRAEVSRNTPNRHTERPNLRSLLSALGEEGNDADGELADGLVVGQILRGLCHIVGHHDRNGRSSTRCVPEAPCSSWIAANRSVGSRSATWTSAGHNRRGMSVTFPLTSLVRTRSDESARRLIAAKMA
jgi:hypothetical protein